MNQELYKLLITHFCYEEGIISGMLNDEFTCKLESICEDLRFEINQYSQIKMHRKLLQETQKELDIIID